MLRKAIGLIVASVVPFMLANALLTSPSNRATEFPAATPAPPPMNADRLSGPPPDAAVNEPSAVEHDEQEEDGAVDMLGNQVTDAVAKYKFDATGSLYELHSPKTELPRLKPAKS